MRKMLLQEFLLARIKNLSAKRDKIELMGFPVDRKMSLIAPINDMINTNHKLLVSMIEADVNYPVDLVE